MVVLGSSLWLREGARVDGSTCRGLVLCRNQMEVFEMDVFKIYFYND